VLRPVLPSALYTSQAVKKLPRQPTGRFVIGGPDGRLRPDGRKIIVDTYGGWLATAAARFSGKDRRRRRLGRLRRALGGERTSSAAGLAKRAEVQVAYAIGVAHPVSSCRDVRTEQEGPAEPRPDRESRRRGVHLRPGAFRES